MKVKFHHKTDDRSGYKFFLGDDNNVVTGSLPVKKKGVKGAEMEICWDVMRIFHCTQFIWNFDIELLGISEILEAFYEFLVCTYTFKNSRCILKILGAFGKFSRHFNVDYISEVSKDIINFRRISKILSVFSKLLVHFKNSW